MVANVMSVSDSAPPSNPTRHIGRYFPSPGCMVPVLAGKCDGETNGTTSRKRPYVGTLWSCAFPPPLPFPPPAAAPRVCTEGPTATSATDVSIVRSSFNPPWPWGWARGGLPLVTDRT